MVFRCGCRGSSAIAHYRPWLHPCFRMESNEDEYSNVETSMVRFAKQAILHRSILQTTPPEFAEAVLQWSVTRRCCICDGSSFVSRQKERSLISSKGQRCGQGNAEKLYMKSHRHIRRVTSRCPPHEACDMSTHWSTGVLSHRSVESCLAL